MATSCLRVNSASYNTPSQTSTVFDFLVVYNNPSVASCVAPASDIISFEVGHGTG